MKTLRVKVKPNARCNKFELMEDGTWLAQVKAPPVNGKANVALVKLIAEHFNLRKSQITIKSGAGARMKAVLIED